jgi:hypothetical protein
VLAHVAFLLHRVKTLAYRVVPTPPPVPNRLPPPSPSPCLRCLSHLPMFSSKQVELHRLDAVGALKEEGDLVADEGVEAGLVRRSRRPHPEKGDEGRGGGASWQREAA